MRRSICSCLPSNVVYKHEALFNCLPANITVFFFSILAIELAVASLRFSLVFMLTIPAPTLLLPREEWPDADFDFPDGVPIHTPFDKDDDDEDWDIQMDFAKTAGPKVETVVPGHEVRSDSSSSQMFIIRPPHSLPDIDNEDDDNDEGVSTIKAAAFPISISKSPQSAIDEDFEDGFALPLDLTQLSLAPLSLNHRSSKNSLQWGDKDQSSSSQSSDAYSSLGFADASPSSASASSASLPETENEDDGDDDDLDGLVIPPALFESGQGSRQLTKILEMKKKAQLTSNEVKVVSPDPEDDFEMGLVIEDDVDLSPSRLLTNAQHHQSQRHFNRTNSMPPQRPTSLRPPSRLNRSKSPLNPPVSSARQLRKIRLSPSPPLCPPTRSQTFQALSSMTPSPPSSMSFLSPKPGSLRGQKSYSGLKPPTPPSSTRRLTRKASLSSLIEASHPQASGSGSIVEGGPKAARYEEPTAASRAKSHKNTTSRIQDFKVPPTRPSTPSSNPAALRLTMPTQSRLKTRPALSGVFAGPSIPTVPSPALCTSSPITPRPPSALARKPSRATNSPPLSVPKILRRPKRQRTYGDGTELDAIDDLPTDREKEGHFRVQPKGYGNRIPGASYPSKSSEKGTVRKKGKREDAGSIEATPPTTLAPSTNSLRRTTARLEFPSKPSSPSEFSSKKKKIVSSPPPHTRRKPTLIRNLGGISGPKVVGEMRWNPLSLRWEGNDHVLRDFDAVVGTSTRPALITHLTGSSIGSPVGSFASGARIVGNMIFDPARMCWISTLPPDEDEPDVFANLADDEEDGDAWETKGGTIRANLQHPGVGSATSASSISSADSSSFSMQADEPSPSHNHIRPISESESGSDRGSRASMVFDVDETFVESCRLVEERHSKEMKGWKSALARQDTFVTPDRSSLYEIRALATRKY